MSGAPLTTFSEDKLDREGIGDYILEFIKTAQPTVNEHSLVLALDSPWGTGKTSFMNMLIDKIENPVQDEAVSLNDSIFCIKYNAWENDDMDDALLPFICNIMDSAKENGVNADKIDEFNKCGKKLIHYGLAGARIISSLITRGTDILGIIKEEVERANEKDKTDSDIILAEYELRKECKENFRIFIECILAKYDRLLISIDELDRCKPTFAIETLEIIKHFFDIPKVVFVFSLDMVQLQASIKSVYGEIDAVNYLQRFFDYRFSFSKPDLKNYIRDLAKETDIDIIRNGVLECMAKKYSISLRTINVICEAYAKFYKTVKTYCQSIPYVSKFFNFYLYFICLKYCDPGKYYDLLHNGVDINDVFEEPLLEIFEWKNVDNNESVSIYAGYVAKKSLQTLYSETGRDQRLFFAKERILIPESATGYLNNQYDFSKITVSDAIYNMIEYGTLTPDAVIKLRG